MKKSTIEDIFEEAVDAGFGDVEWFEVDLMIPVFHKLLNEAYDADDAKDSE